MSIFDHHALRASTIIAATAAFGLACGPGGPGPNGEPSNVPGLEEVWIDAGDGLDHGMLTTVTLNQVPESGGEASPISGTLEIERTFNQVLTAEGLFEDSATVDLTREGNLSWSSSDSAIVAVELVEAGAQLTAVAEGTAVVTAEIGSLRAELTVTVIPPALVELSITAPGDLFVKTASQLTATARYRDDSTRDVTAEASWSSAAPDQVAVLDDAGRKGIAYPLSRQETTLTATFEDQTATFQASVACSLDAGASILENEIMPNASWPNAVIYDADGNRTDRALSIEEMLCDDQQFGGIRAFAFSINAGWCGPCHLWMRTAAAGEADLLANGIMPVFVVGDGVRRQSYSSATTEYANQLSTTHAGDAMSIRLGDAETMGAGANGIKQVLNQTQAWPSLFVVDRADMRVISLASGAPRSVAGLIQIAEAAGGGGGGGGTPVMSNCAEGADEATEPNDIPQLAPEIGVGSFTGGICNNEPDYFDVNVDGAWRATIMFENGTADLDLFGWDAENDAVLQVNGMPVQSVSVRQSFESIELSGPATIAVRSKARGTVEYTLFVEAI